MRRHRLDAVRNDLLLAVRDIGLAPAIEAVLGFDATEQQILRAAGPEDKGFDARNFHVPSGDASGHEPIRLAVPALREWRGPGSAADRVCVRAAVQLPGCAKPSH